MHSYNEASHLDNVITPSAQEVTMSKSIHYSDFGLASFHYDTEINN